METKPTYTANQQRQPRLLEIAIALGELYTGIRLVDTALAHKRQDLEGRQLYLAPDGGWPGKDEGESKLAQEREYSKDETCKGLRALIRDNEGQLAELQAQAQGLEAERRALEWLIRGQLVDALRANHIDQSGPDTAAFDDAADNETVETVVGDVPRAAWDEHARRLADDANQFYAEEQAWNEHGRAPLPDDLPF